MKIAKILICKVEGCNEKHYCKGYCSLHYQRLKSKRPIIDEKQVKGKHKNCTIKGCDEKHYAKGFCRHHYHHIKNTTDPERIKLLRKIRDKYSKTDKGKKAQQNNRKKRKALIRGATIEKFFYLDVYERDGYICSICGLPIDKTLHFPNPLSITLEHNIPIAKGGSHSYNNCSPAHFICNLRKRDKLISGNFEGASI